MHILLLGLCRVQAVNTRPGYLGAHSLALGHRGRGCRESDSGVAYDRACSDAHCGRKCRPVDATRAAHPTPCQHGPPLGSGRQIVSWSPCHWAPVRAAAGTARWSAQVSLRTAPSGRSVFSPHSIRCPAAPRARRIGGEVVLVAAFALVSGPQAGLCKTVGSAYVGSNPTPATS